MTRIKEVIEDIIPIKYDRIFKDLFNENNMNFINWVVMQILEVDYKEVKGKITVVNSTLEKRREKEKRKYLDLRLKVKDESILIELNLNYLGNPLKSMEYATSFVGTTYDNKKESSYVMSYYKKPVRCILVNLNWYHKSAKKLQEEAPLKDETYWNYPKTSRFKGYYIKIISINLDKYASLCYDDVKKYDKLYKLLTITSKKELEKITKDEKLLKEYKEKLYSLSENDLYKEDLLMSEARERYHDNSDAYFLGELDGEAKGRTKGIMENKREMIINMNQEKMPIEMIAKIAKISIEEVKEIISSSKDIETKDR